jgi:adenine-specific DNA-methyltransferase
MSRYNDFKAILDELFMLDAADLDFGIYRIMNQKRDDINRFLGNDLQHRVKSALHDTAKGVNDEHLRQKLIQAEESARNLGLSPNSVEAVRNLRLQLEAAPDLAQLENTVYSHLTAFFRRYYRGGDFVALRRYKADTYAIPYSGEEVKLYWANHDQYYIKTAEQFTRYQFTLPNGKAVVFTLTEADTEHDNNKAAIGKERRFMLAANDEHALSLASDGQTLTIRFRYELTDKAAKQDALNAEAFAHLKSRIPAGFEHLLSPQPTDKQPGRTLLEKHLRDYTARHSFDYFIHKNLGAFLRRELDFFLKNEVLFLDDFDPNETNDLRQQLAVMHAIKTVAHIIIDFLAQLEDFQKRLWLKKKFVLETSWCITLDRIPSEFHARILANERQCEAWKHLFDVRGGGLQENFALTHPHLPVDTSLFDDEFTADLLAHFDNLDEQTSGLLLHGDNFHALNLLQERYHEQVQCVYIDPPYNTAASEILYKNEFKHSSWLCLMENRLLLSIQLLRHEGIVCVTIDDYEFHPLRYLLDSLMGSEAHLGTAPIRNNPQGRSTVKGFAINHEYALFFANEGVKSVGRLERTTEQIARYNETDENGLQYLWENFRKTGTDSHRADRPKQFYPIYFDGTKVRVPSMEWNDTERSWDNIEEPKNNESKFFPIDENGTERVGKWGFEAVIEKPHHLRISEGQNNTLQVYRRNYLNTLGALPSTWWDKAKYAAGSHGTNLLTDFFGVSHSFQFPKSVHAVADSIQVGTNNSKALILDYFAGSGTTAHAVINLNREDGGQRKYVLVEMGEYFDAVTKPRVLKAAYSADWRDGKPTSAEKTGVSQIVKILRLESYEDTLNALELRRTVEQDLFLEQHPALSEDYTVRYMTDVESRESLMSPAMFRNPFDVRMRLVRGNAEREQRVDMVETFNYLLGLQVEHRYRAEGYCILKGATRQGEKVLVVWRNLENPAHTDEALNEFLLKSRYNPLDGDFDRIYVNGDNTVENLKMGEERWKVVLTEEEFLRRMFALG